MDRSLVWLLAVASGLAVANLYYIQPILADVGRSFHVTSGVSTVIATMGQLGYALGLLLIVPLGDSRDRRGLIVATLVAVAVALAAVALAPGPGWLAAALFAVGLTTVVPQIIVPLAASMAGPSERGQVVGTVMSGLLIGILLARTVSGVLSAYLGWHAMYWIASALMLALAGLLRVTLPKNEPHVTLSYPELLRSLWHLLRDEPVVREASTYGGLVFGAFSAFWVTLAFFLETPPYHYGSEVAGLFGLVGVVGALGASGAGKLADRVEPRHVTGAALTITLAAFVLFWSTGHHLAGLIAGVILLDLGTQAAHISNQTRIYSLNPAARSRLNTVYMVSYFVGGSLGSFLGAYGWSRAGWSGVCATGTLMLVLALLVYGVTTRRRAGEAVRV